MDLCIVAEMCSSINNQNTCGNELCLIESKVAIEAAETLFHAVLTDGNSR
jgi:hypothetical protein